MTRCQRSVALAAADGIDCHLRDSNGTRHGLLWCLAKVSWMHHTVLLQPTHVVNNTCMLGSSRAMMVPFRQLMPSQALEVLQGLLPLCQDGRDPLGCKPSLNATSTEAVCTSRGRRGSGGVSTSQDSVPCIYGSDVEAAARTLPKQMDAASRLLLSVLSPTFCLPYAGGERLHVVVC